MTITNIPLTAEPSQECVIQLSGQRCRIKVYEKRRYPIGEPQTSAHYLDLYVNDVLVVGGAILQDGKPVVVDDYKNFIGDIFIYDTGGMLPPETSGLGDRWQLGYATGLVVPPEPPPLAFNTSSAIVRDLLTGADGVVLTGADNAPLQAPL